MPNRTCLNCAAVLEPGDTRKKYCGTRCRESAKWARRREYYLPAEREKTRAARESVVKTCPYCGVRFSPEAMASQKYCSRACRKKANADSRVTACTVDDCDRPHRAKGMCSMHYKRALRAEGRMKNAPWDEKAKARKRRRNALKKGASTADPFSYSDVFERDAWICGICSDPVDPAIDWPDPRSRSLDHVIPLVHGGEHSFDNAQLAHLECNIRKGARVE